MKISTQIICKDDSVKNKLPGKRGFKKRIVSPFQGVI